MAYNRYPQKTRKQARREREAIETPSLVADEALDFDELSIEDVFKAHRSIHYKNEASFPQETFYLAEVELGQTYYREILSAQLNDFGRYTLKVARWGTVWALSIDASESVYKLKP